MLYPRNVLMLAGLGLILFLSSIACTPKVVIAPEKKLLISDHFNGEYFVNPNSPSKKGESMKRGVLGYIWHTMTDPLHRSWPEFVEYPPGPPPPDRVPRGKIRITYIGQCTFLIQMDGINILTDPVWADRASPFSWLGPKRHTRPGLRIDDLPPIDVVLLSHNHYDHLDLPPFKYLAEKGTQRSLVPLGNAYLVRETGIPIIDELDWWESTCLSPDITVTLVPAQHLSSRTLFDRNKALWGGFVISGPSGHVYFAGDTGYGSFFQEIGNRFSPIRVAIIPISPYSPKSSDEPSTKRLRVHMRSREAVKAHKVDLKAQVSIASHYRVFQLGADTYDDAVKELTASLKPNDLKPEDFLALDPGQSYEIQPGLTEGQK
jgi:L-ascorbate metabolism protein UlaG (beta-lactamase superfamily)